VFPLDTIARLSVYNVQSSNAVHTTLLEHVLPPKTAIPNTLVMIILDWTKPWTFVEQLEIWLKWVEKWAKGDGSRELEVLREEGKDRCKDDRLHREMRD
jgi:dynein light intermediate chain 1